MLSVPLLIIGRRSLNIFRYHKGGLNMRHGLAMNLFCLSIKMGATHSMFKACPIYKERSIFSSRT